MSNLHARKMDNVPATIHSLVIICKYLQCINDIEIYLSTVYDGLLPNVNVVKIENEPGNWK